MLSVGWQDIPDITYYGHGQKWVLVEKYVLAQAFVDRIGVDLCEPVRVMISNDLFGGDPCFGKVKTWSFHKHGGFREGETIVIHGLTSAVRWSDVPETTYFGRREKGVWVPVPKARLLEIMMRHGRLINTMDVALKISTVAFGQDPCCGHAKTWSIHQDDPVKDVDEYLWVIFQGCDPFYYPELDIVYYRLFQPDLKELSDDELYIHFHNRKVMGTMNRIPVYDTSKIDTIFINAHYIRVMKTPKDIPIFKNHLRNIIPGYDPDEQYMIYNEASFYELYPDFDAAFYADKYLSSIDHVQDKHLTAMVHYHLIGRSRRYITSPIRKILVYSFLYDANCGGVLAMHHLVKMINEFALPNVEARLINPFDIRYENPFTNKFASVHDATDSSIVIYPEVIFENPLGATNVVRWILLALGIEMPLDHYKNWSPNDLVYSWEPKPGYRQLCLPWFNPIFRNTNPTGSRLKTCYVIKKGPLIHKPPIRYSHPPDAILIDDYSHRNNTRYVEDVCAIFNQCSECYIYDPNTAFILFAAVCGCVPIVYPIEGVSKDEYLASRITRCGDTTYDFIAYGNDPAEIEHARKTIPHAREMLDKIYDYYLTGCRQEIERLILSDEPPDNTVQHVLIDESAGIMEDLKNP